MSSPSFTGDKQDASARNSTQFYEMTEEDITALESIDADEISVLGIHLGSTIQQVRNIVSNRIGFVLKQDKFNNNRFYLYDEQQGSGKSVLLAYFKWPHEDSTMHELIIYPGLSDYMKGASKKLVTNATMDFENGIGKNFLGYPFNKTVTLDVASLGLKHTAYFYKDKQYQVIKQVKKKQVKYAFGLFSEYANPRDNGTKENP